jgi:hypothetical protein
MSQFSKIRREMNDAIRTIAARHRVILSRDQMRLIRKGLAKEFRKKHEKPDGDLPERNGRNELVPGDGPASAPEEDSAG